VYEYDNDSWTTRSSHGARLGSSATSCSDLPKSADALTVRKPPVSCDFISAIKLNSPSVPHILTRGHVLSGCVLICVNKSNHVGRVLHRVKLSCDSNCNVIEVWKNCDAECTCFKAHQTTSLVLHRQSV